MNIQEQIDYIKRLPVSQDLIDHILKKEFSHFSKSNQNYSFTESNPLEIEIAETGNKKRKLPTLIEIENEHNEIQSPEGQENGLL
jgi:hypothetical protein